MIDHPNIVKLIEVLASKTKIYLVLEYIEGGELWNKISILLIYQLLLKLIKKIRGKRENRRGGAQENIPSDYSCIGLL